MWRDDRVSREVVVDGARFRVDMAAGMAEAHRLGLDLRLARGPMVRRGELAILRATGCPIRPGTLEGDQAIVRAELDCTGGQSTTREIGNRFCTPRTCVIKKQERA